MKNQNIFFKFSRYFESRKEERLSSSVLYYATFASESTFVILALLMLEAFCMEYTRDIGNPRNTWQLR